MFDHVISQSQQFAAGWGKLWKLQLERIEAASEEAVKLQQQSTARTGEVLDELAKLSRASLDYANRLGAEWSRAGLDAWRRGVDTMAPPSTRAPGSQE